MATDTPDAKHDPDEKETSPLRVAIGVLGGSVALVVAIVMIVQFAIETLSGPGKGDPAMSEEAVARRLKPVGELVVAQANAPAIGEKSAAAAPAPQPEAPRGASPAATTDAATAPAPSAGAEQTAQTAQGSADLSNGKATYESVCVACHGAGLLNAPKAGDKAAWGPRIAAGIDSLYHSALNGKNAMPPKGGNTSLPDTDVKAAVDYMVSLAK